MAEARRRKEALATQLDELRSLMEASRRALGFDEDAFREALSSSLELSKAEPLVLTTVKGRPAYRFPALDQRAGADPTWAGTLDTLRRRRRKDEKPWDWRRDSPPRPVVFADPGTLDDEFVHLHLEHRVARRLLGRLSAYGDGTARLHDEVIALAARWIEPDARKGPLRPYATPRRPRNATSPSSRNRSSAPAESPFPSRPARASSPLPPATSTTSSPPFANVAKKRSAA